MNDDALNEAQRREIQDAIVNGQKIQAIKHYREATGCELKTAKEAVEKMTEDLAQTHPELKTRKPAGCMSLVILGTALPFTYGIAQAFQNLL